MPAPALVTLGPLAMPPALPSGGPAAADLRSALAGETPAPVRTHRPQEGVDSRFRRNDQGGRDARVRQDAPFPGRRFRDTAQSGFGMIPGSFRGRMDILGTVIVRTSFVQSEIRR